MRAEYYLGLVGGAAVIVPDGQLLHVRGFLVQRLGLAPESLASPVNPDVERLHPEANHSSVLQQQPISDQYCNFQQFRDQYFYNQPIREQYLVFKKSTYQNS